MKDKKTESEKITEAFERFVRESSYIPDISCAAMARIDLDKYVEGCRKALEYKG